jgi:hypothetical protein
VRGIVLGMSTGEEQGCSVAFVIGVLRYFSFLAMKYMISSKHGIRSGVFFPHSTDSDKMILLIVIHSCLRLDSGISLNPSLFVKGFVTICSVLERDPRVECPQLIFDL